MKCPQLQKLPSKAKVEELIKSSGARVTRQRKAVLETIYAANDHPTASLIYQRAKKRRAGISLATVYNSLESMVASRLINQLNTESGPSRYCINITPHAHLLDEKSKLVIDITLKEGIRPEDVFDLPEGVIISHMDTYLYGVIPDAAHTTT